MLKTLAKRALQSFGYDVVEYPRLPLLVHHLRRLFADNNINTVLDVGAYVGKYCQTLRKHVHYRGTILSFEPTFESFKQLTAQMAGDPDWRGYNFGLSNEGKKVAFHVHPSNGDWNSVLKIKVDAARAYEFGGASTTETVQFKMLDSVWDELGLPSARVFMKMDTQGHDLEVLLGASAHHSQIIGLQSELPAIELYDGMASMSKSLAVYRDHGFTPIGFYPVNTPAAYKGAVPEFDVLFLRAQ